MNNNALSMANYFVDLSHNSGKSIQPLKLMKLVYIAYGFGLAILNRSIIDYRFDKVEAWRLGPVIPSVYWSFKQYGRGEVKEKTKILVDDSLEDITPELTDDLAKAVCRMVWRVYGGYSASELVSILHDEGTPWSAVYEPEKNKPIPEYLTRRYYTLLYQAMKNDANGK